MRIELDPEFVITSQPAWSWLVKHVAGFRCQRCGATEELVSHHINGKGHEGDNRLSNGECLCTSCHMSHHMKARWEVNRGRPCHPNVAAGLRRGAKAPASQLQRQHARNNAVKRNASTNNPFKSSEKQTELALRPRKRTKCEPDCQCGRHRK